MAKAIASVANYDPLKTNIDGDMEHVLDGGRLIHLIKWQKNETSSDIYKRYSNFVLDTYGCVTIVFGSFDVPPTKDIAH